MRSSCEPFIFVGILYRRSTAVTPQYRKLLFTFNLLMWLDSCVNSIASPVLEFCPIHPDGFYEGFAMWITTKTFLVTSFAAMLTALAVGSASASVVQSIAPASSDTCCWNQVTLGTVTFASGTNSVLGLTSTAIAYDQGFGGYDPVSNQVVIQLYNGASYLWGAHVAGGLRGAGATTVAQLFNINSSPALLISLNQAMALIDWSTTPTITMSMISAGLGYPAWQLHVRNASFTVTSDTVPEPASLALLGLGLAGLWLSRRRKLAA